MLAPRVLVLRAPGTNCDYETARGFERAGGIPRRVHVRSLAERPATVDDCQILCIPGGFSYGDDIASGRIFALELKTRLADALVKFRDRGGLVRLDDATARIIKHRINPNSGQRMQLGYQLSPATGRGRGQCCRLRSVQLRCCGWRECCTHTD